MKLLDKNTELSIAIEAEIDDLVEDVTTVYNSAEFLRSSRRTERSAAARARITR